MNFVIVSAASLAILALVYGATFLIGRHIGRYNVVDVTWGASFVVVAAVAAAVDPRIHTLLLSGGGDLDGDGGYWDLSKPMCQALPYKALHVLPHRAEDLFALNQQRGATLLINGLADRVVDIPHHGPDFFDGLRASAIALSGTKKNAFETIFLPGVGHRPSWVTRPAALWLQAQLHFPAWDEAAIRALPETRIADWAAKNGVTVDRNAMREEAEGGTPALLTDVPAPPAAQLDALSAEQWNEQRERLIYDTWVTRALEEEGIRGEAAKALVATSESTH